MPTNESRLKAKLVEMGFSYEYCAKELGISKNTFTKKINNVEKFSIPQANKLAEILKLSQEEKVLIFFS
ncbi:helix-turn-helix transcriptional regulator [Thomasclavelia spiroformis]|uniref:helix-turn-helix transcriptional regulator n=1 Tax=Thomasclavelia spiroformis TaxID=29348 RepID=UPI003209AE67